LLEENWGQSLTQTAVEEQAYRARSMINTKRGGENRDRGGNKTCGGEVTTDKSRVGARQFQAKKGKVT